MPDNISARNKTKQIHHSRKINSQFNQAFLVVFVQLIKAKLKVLVVNK